jgi:hypothetical protein
MVRGDTGDNVTGGTPDLLSIDPWHDQGSRRR